MPTEITRREAALWLEKHIVKVEEQFLVKSVKYPPMIVNVDEDPKNWCFDLCKNGEEETEDKEYKVKITLSVPVEGFKVTATIVFEDFNQAMEFAKQQLQIERGDYESCSQKKN